MGLMRMLWICLRVPKECHRTRTRAGECDVKIDEMIREEADSASAKKDIMAIWLTRRSLDVAINNAKS